MIKKSLQGIAVLCLLAVLVLLGLYFIPPKQEQVAYDYVTEEAVELDSKVGWYATPNDEYYQVTWSAKTGLQVNYFDSLRSNLKSLRLHAITDSDFDTDGNKETTEAIFSFNPSDSTQRLVINTSRTNLDLVRVDSLFYNQKEIEYWSGDVRLTGLLLEPYTNAKSTAVVFIHGSGISDRNNFWYMYQADYLARQGYVVLLPDKRGCGKSRGEWHTASFSDFARDTEAAIVYLNENNASSFEQIGVIGLSQGGWISHLLNQHAHTVDFVVDVVGSSTTPNEQVEFEIMNEMISSGVPKVMAHPLSLVFAQRVRGKRKIWWDKNGNFDPLPLMAKSRVPVLKIFAGQDQNVPVERSQERIHMLLREQTDLSIELKQFDGAGHALFNAETSWIRSDYLEYVNHWLSALQSSPHDSSL